MKMERDGDYAARAEECLGLPETGNGQERFFPYNFHREHGPANFDSDLLLFRTNCETRHFCCSKPLSWWHFVTGALGK